MHQQERSLTPSCCGECTAVWCKMLSSEKGPNKQVENETEAKLANEWVFVFFILYLARGCTSKRDETMINMSHVISTDS